MNNKGFMMAELVVVSSIVLVTLVSFYSSYNKILSMYKTRLTYYDVTTLYRLSYYRDILKTNNLLDTSKTGNVITASHSGVVEIYNSSSRTGSVFALPAVELPTGVNDVVFMVNNDGGKIDRSIFSGKTLHLTFLEYIDYLEYSIDNYNEFDYMLVMERCNKDVSGRVNENDCNYAYLEIYT